MVGKVALVTGASRGIGKGIALELARTGCDVMLTASNQDALQSVAKEVSALGRKAGIYAADLRVKPEPEGWSQRSSVSLAGSIFLSIMRVAPGVAIS